MVLHNDKAGGLSSVASGQGGVVSKTVKTYVAAIHRGRKVVAGFWFLCLLIGGWKGLNLIKACVLKFAPPSGSPAEAAQDALTSMFPDAAAAVPLSLVLHRKNDSSALGEDLRNYTWAIQDHVRQYCENTPGASGVVKAGGIAGFYTSSATSGGPKAAAPAAFEGRLHANPYMASFSSGGSGGSSPWLGGTNGSWTIIIIDVMMPHNSSLTGAPNDLAKDMLTASKALAKISFPNDEVSVELTGMLVFAIEVLKGTEHDLVVMDGTAFPLALAVLAYILKAARLLIIPILSILISVLTAYLIMWPIALHMVVISFAPSVMMSATIAMSIDYSLFLLSRYREELLNGRKPYRAIEYMIASAGHTVLVSGSTLAMCFLALMFFPSPMLISTGLGCAIAITIAIMVNLSLTPAMLMLFEKFFARSIEESVILAWFCPAKKKHGSALPNQRSLDIQDGNDFGSDDDALLGHDDDEPLRDIGLLAGLASVKNTVWYRFADRVSTRYPWVVLTVLVAFAVPCTVSAMGMQRTLSTLSFTPRGSEGTTGFADLASNFGAGFLFRYFLIVQAPAGTPTIFSQAVFNITNELLVAPHNSFLAIRNDTGLTGLTYVSDSSTLVNGIVSKAAQHNISANTTNKFIDLFIDDGRIQEGLWDDVLMWTANCTDNKAGFPAAGWNATADLMGQVCPYLVSHYSNTTGQPNALMTDILLKIDPFQEEGVKWLQQARDAVSDWEARHPGFRAYIGGGAAINVDVVAATYGAFPMAIGLTAAFVLVWIGISFKSVMVPVRAVFTLAITILYVYGCAVYVYQDGALNGLGIPGLQGQGAISWISPIMCFSIVVGLGLDYDVFLISRVLEYRKLGLTTKQAVLYGFAQTGPIITAAGAIMAIAFAGLLFSSEGALNEMSFYLVFAVLFDTLVVRSLLVPSVMVILGEWNWWPAKMPPSNAHLVYENP